MRAALALALLAAPAWADPPLTGEAFDALTLGRTMTWAEFGQVYGVEQYLPGRRVRWTVLGDDCVAGHWYPDGSAICFQYEDNPSPVCWEITARGSGLGARLLGSPKATAPVVIEDARDPMPCLGPEVGA